MDINEIIKKVTFAVIGIILLIWVLFNVDVAMNLWKYISNVLQPFFFGVLMALFLNAPVKFFE